MTQELGRKGVIGILLRFFGDKKIIYFSGNLLCKSMERGVCR
jgi:hypothetical protein